MSNYDNMIKNAFDKIEPPSDDETFIKGIIERADNMEKEKGIIKTEQKRLVEITVPKVEKKPSRAPWIAGAAALTAAALGIGFVAGGGIKPGGSDIKSTPANGAGYSDTAASPAVTTVPVMSDGGPYESSAYQTTSLLHIPEAGGDDFDSLEYYEDADKTIEFDKCSVRVNGYSFDGISFTLYYDVISKNGEYVNDDPDTSVVITSGENESVTESHLTDVKGNTAHWITKGVLCKSARDLDLYFGTYAEDENGKRDLKFMFDDEYRFTVGCGEEAIKYLFLFEGAESTISYANFCNVYISPVGFALTYPGKGMDGWGDGSVPSKVPEVKIELGDGTEAFISKDSLRSGFDWKFGYVAGSFLEKLDTRRIKSVIVDDRVIFISEKETGGISYDGVAPSADDPAVYGFRDYSIKIRGITFSGDMITAAYDVTYPDGVPSSESEDGEPRVLPCPINKLYELERIVFGMEISRSMASDSHTMHYNVRFKYETAADQADIVFYDTKHFIYSNDIPYNLTYTAPIYVMREGADIYHDYDPDSDGSGDPSDTTGTTVTAAAPVGKVSTDIEGKTFVIGGREFTIASCAHDGNILRIVIETSDGSPIDGYEDMFRLTPVIGGSMPLTQGHRRLGSSSLMLYASLQVVNGGSAEIVLGDFGTSGVDYEELLSFTICGCDAVAAGCDVRRDRVGVELNKAGFGGPEGLIYEGLTVSDLGVVFTFASNGSTEPKHNGFKDFTFTAKDRDGNVYDLAKDGIIYQEIGSGRFIYEVLLTPELDGKKLTDMKLISVNGLNTLLAEMSPNDKQTHAEFTTAVVTTYTPPFTVVTTTVNEADTTRVP